MDWSINTVKVMKKEVTIQPIADLKLPPVLAGGNSKFCIIPELLKNQIIKNRI
jgi:hypothetical protein